MMESEVYAEIEESTLGFRYFFLSVFLPVFDFFSVFLKELQHEWMADIVTFYSISSILRIYHGHLTAIYIGCVDTEGYRIRIPSDRQFYSNLDFWVKVMIAGNVISNVKKRLLKKTKYWRRNGSFTFWPEVKMTCLIDDLFDWHS